MPNLTLATYNEWVRKLHARVFDACVILPDLQYARRGFDPGPELDVLNERFFVGVFWKNKYVIVTQLHKVLYAKERESLSKLLDELDHPTLDETLVNAFHCTSEVRKAVVERCRTQIAGHSEEIRSNGVVRNKSVAHADAQSPVPANHIDLPVLERLTGLAVNVLTEMERTLFSRHLDFNVPPEIGLEHLIQRSVRAEERSISN